MTWFRNVPHRQTVYGELIWTSHYGEMSKDFEILQLLGVAVYLSILNSRARGKELGVGWLFMGWTEEVGKRK